ncbi:TetR/AcrR family transcriptional regulator C-terminal domain-containing protein [Paenibacillus sp. JNUCC31]|uniref:TetR/AcrR family transcriptional regulator C-terminal domain-containing protein n=1 Tax=Paenibacillus sp. JNUCC-31 TaxID=2777983 RepID=UPI003A4C7B48
MILSVLHNFGVHYLQQRCSPDTIAVNRMLISESAKSEIGILFYQEGQRKIIHMLSELFEKAMKDSKIKRNKTAVVVSHYIALIESKLLEKCLLGIILKNLLISKS